MRAGIRWGLCGGVTTCPFWGLLRPGMAQEPAFLMRTGPRGRQPLPGLSWPTQLGPFQEQGARGSQGWGKACLFLGIHGMSACHKYLDREDLWVRFAILFSPRVINQLHAHPGCSVGLRRTHTHTHTRALCRNAVRLLPAIPWARRRSSPES